MCGFNNCFVFYQSECEQKGESYWYSATASVVTRIVENIEVIFLYCHGYFFPCTLLLL